MWNNITNIHSKGVDIMGFRYDMRNNSPQQKAIVRQRDKNEEIKKEVKRKLEQEELKKLGQQDAE